MIFWLWWGKNSFLPVSDPFITYKYLQNHLQIMYEPLYMYVLSTELFSREICENQNWYYFLLIFNIFSNIFIFQYHQSPKIYKIVKWFWFFCKADIKMCMYDLTKTTVVYANDLGMPNVPWKRGKFL